MGLFDTMISKDKTASGFEINESLMWMQGGFTLFRLSGMLGIMNVHLTKEQLLSFNEKLNQIARN